MVKFKLFGNLCLFLIILFSFSCTKEEIGDKDLKEKGTVFLLEKTEAKFNVVENSTGEYLYDGLDFNCWDIVLGDAEHNLDDEEPVGPGDIETVHTGEESVLVANTEGRDIMAHNITYKKVLNPNLLVMSHEAKFNLRLPYQVSTATQSYHGQTIEGGLFVWDGEDTRLDYGLAFQWVINPWIPEFETIRYWDGLHWNYLTTLETDLEYHSVFFELDIVNETAFLTIDGQKINQNIFSKTVKTGWGTEIAGRLQAEVISVFPSEELEYQVYHNVYFKNWMWLANY